MQSPSARQNSASSSLPTRRDAMKAVSVVVGSATGGRRWRARCPERRTFRRRQGISLRPRRRGWSKRFPSRIIPADKDPGAKDARVVVIHRPAVGRTVRATPGSVSRRPSRLAGDMPQAVRQAFRSSALGRPNESPGLARSGTGAEGALEVAHLHASSSIWCWSTPSRASMEARRMAEIAITSAFRCSVWTVRIGRGGIEIRAASRNLERNRRVPNRHVNALVVGAGAGGGVVAKELAVAGLSVVLLEPRAVDSLRRTWRQ